MWLISKPNKLSEPNEINMSMSSIRSIRSTSSKRMRQSSNMFSFTSLTFNKGIVVGASTSDLYFWIVSVPILFPLVFKVLVYFRFSKTFQGNSNQMVPGAAFIAGTKYEHFAPLFVPAPLSVPVLKTEPGRLRELFPFLYPTSRCKRPHPSYRRISKSVPRFFKPPLQSQFSPMVKSQSF